MVRSPEFDNGIAVMDRNGNVVGVSKKAGEKVGEGHGGFFDLLKAFPFIPC